jgi:glycosyltransferase involved in cell wall biosynthesis
VRESTRAAGDQTAVRRALQPAAAPARWRRRVAFYLDSTTVGGAEIVVRDLVARLSDDTDVAVIGVDPDIVAEVSGERPGVKQVVVAPIHGRRDLRGMRAHRQVFAQLRPDILHVNLAHLGACQWALCVARTVPGLRIVAVEHSLVPAGSRASRLLKRLTSRFVDAHVAVGDHSARMIESMVGVRRGRVRAIHNGVHELEPVPHHGKAGSLELGWIGRMEHAKGVDVLLDALVDVPEARLLLVGDGDERLALQRQAFELGIASRVEFRPWSDNARAALNATDVFVLPSRLESFPLAVLEAMMVALPVVATDVGSISEAIIDGANGLLVPPDDPGALAAALRALVDDPERRALMGATGRALARYRFDVGRMARAYEALYDELLTGGHPVREPRATTYRLPRATPAR